MNRSTAKMINIARRAMDRKPRAADAGKSRSIARAARQAAGFSLTEALATLVIVGLVTIMLASGIALATRQYTNSLASSQSQMLYSSLQQILDTELRYTSEVFTKDGSAVGFTSKHYIAKGNDVTNLLVTINANDEINPMTEPGELALSNSFDQDETAVNRLLGSGAYNYELKASVQSFSYDSITHDFFVRLYITKGSNLDDPLAKGDFTVRAMNNPKITSLS